MGEPEQTGKAPRPLRPLARLPLTLLKLAAFASIVGAIAFAYFAFLANQRIDGEFVDQVTFDTSLWFIEVALMLFVVSWLASLVMLFRWLRGARRNGEKGLFKSAWWILLLLFLVGVAATIWFANEAGRFPGATPVSDGHESDRQFAIVGAVTCVIAFLAALTDVRLIRKVTDRSSPRPSADTDDETETGPPVTLPPLPEQALKPLLPRQEEPDSPAPAEAESPLVPAADTTPGPEPAPAPDLPPATELSDVLGGASTPAPGFTAEPGPEPGPPGPPVPDPAVEPQPEPGLHPGPEPQPESGPQPQPQPEPHSEPQPEPQPEPQTPPTSAPAPGTAPVPPTPAPPAREGSQAPPSAPPPWLAR